MSAASGARGAPAGGRSVRRLVESQDELLRYFRRRTPSSADAHDLLQETNARVLARGPDDPGRAWLYRVARSVLVDHFRREAARSRGLAAYRADPASEPVEEAPIVPCGCVHRVLALLPPLDGEVLRRADLDREPHGVIARALATTANAVGVRLHRARKALRLRLEAHCGECCSRDPLRCGCVVACKDHTLDASSGATAKRLTASPISHGDFR